METTLNLTKKCKVCKKCLTLDKFYSSKISKDGVEYICKKCRSKKQSRLWKTDTKFREKHRSYNRKSDLKRYYNITLEEYDIMFERQKVLCAICGNEEIRKNQYGITRLSVDHNHTTNKVRGLLCSSCNVKLGWFENNKISVLSYLKGYD